MGCRSLFPKCLINTFLSLSFQMAMLLCIPQFIALNLLAHTLASGHCSLRHARGRGGALTQHALYANVLFPFGSTVRVIWLQACEFCVGTERDVWLWLSRCGSCQVTSLTDLALAGDGLLEWTLKDVFTGPHQIYPVFNCIGEQSVSALQILGKAELYNRAIIAGV